MYYIASLSQNDLILNTEKRQTTLVITSEAKELHDITIRIGDPRFAWDDAVKCGHRSAENQEGLVKGVDMETNP